MSAPDPDGEGARSSRVLVIAGPTAGGKSAVAHEIALRTGGEVVVMDSMKVYRELDIATAKPDPGRRAEVAYHLVDVVDPSVDFSVGDYLGLLDATLEDLAARGRLAVVSAGTPLYLKAFLEGFSRGPPADWTVRQRLLDEARDRGPEALHARLGALDPPAAARIHPRDLRRIVRSLEVVELTGKPRGGEGSWGSGPAGSRRSEVHGLAWDRSVLYGRVDRRVERMVRAGLFEEAARLAARVPPLSRSAAQCIGYKEIREGEARGAARSEIVEAIQRKSRRLAKHQLTWLRRLPIAWIPVGEDDDAASIATRVLEAS